MSLMAAFERVVRERKFLFREANRFMFWVQDN